MTDRQDDAIARAVSHGKNRTVTEAVQQWKPRLEAFLAAHGDARGPATVGEMRVPSDGGASSGTLIFTARYGDGSIDRLVLRYHPETGHAHEYDMIGQYHILKALMQTDVPSPRVLDLDATGEFFGVPGFLMYCIDGTALPATYPVNGPLFDAAPQTRKRMIEETLEAMAKIHRVDWQALGLEQHTRKGKGSTRLERDLDWYLTALRWGCPEAVVPAQPALDWLLAHQFEPAVVSLCHGDCSLHNYMYKNGHLVAVLDWEFAFIGTPEVDLAFQMIANEILSLGHPPLEGMPDAAERKAIYERFAGRTLEHWNYYLAIASFKIYTHMALSFRDLPPDMNAARDKYVGYPLSLLMKYWEAAKR